MASVAAVVASTETDAIARGRALFTAGLHADGKPIVARAGDTGVPLPASFVACVQCHGYDARGKTEAGVTVSDIRWETLSKPYALPRADGRERAPYDERAFFRAVTSGRDARNQPLRATMPRFELTDTECVDLCAYLKSLEDVTHEGVNSAVIRLGLVVPAQATDSAALEERVLRAWAEGVNARGGIFRRRVEWTRIDSLTLEAAPPVVAMYMLDGVAPAVAAACERARIPHVQRVADETTASRYAFAFLPDVVERTVVLVRYAAAQTSNAPSAIALLYAPDFPDDAIVRALGPQAASSNMTQMRYSDATASRIVRELTAAGLRKIVLAGRLSQFHALLASGAAKNAAITFLSPDLSTPLAPSETGPRLFAARCAAATDLSPEAEAILGQLAAKNGTVPEDDACAVLSAVRLLEFALANAGRELGREKLRDTLEALNAVRTGVTPSAGFTPRRHIAAAGVYVVPLTEQSRDARAAWLPFDFGS